MPTGKTKNILIAPLDWGLGHTSRCISLIRHIRSLGHNAIIAGNDSQVSFLRASLGDNISAVHLAGYNICYSKWNRWAQIGLLSQLPHIMRTINTEHLWLQRQVADLSLDGIISDNRYGLFHPSIPSVILTHQLQVLSGFNNTADKMVRLLHYKYLDRFNETWVVDTLREPNLGGKLSHPELLPKQTKYIGLLSRFAGTSDEVPPAHKEQHLLILLSGPEPQRTALSDMLWRQLQNFHGKVTFVEGSEDAGGRIAPPNIACHKRLSGDALSALLNNCDMVICRSGYSTLMDLIALHKKAIIIPTPGQTEQEYLGSYLHQQDAYYCATQYGFDLQRALAASAHFPFKLPLLNNAYNEYQKAIENWLAQ